MILIMPSASWDHQPRYGDPELERSFMRPDSAGWMVAEPGQRLPRVKTVT